MFFSALCFHFGFGFITLCVDSISYFNVTLHADDSHIVWAFCCENANPFSRCVFLTCLRENSLLIL